MWYNRYYFTVNLKTDPNKSFFGIPWFIIMFFETISRDSIITSVYRKTNNLDLKNHNWKPIVLLFSLIVKHSRQTEKQKPENSCCVLFWKTTQLHKHKLNYLYFSYMTFGLEVDFEVDFEVGSGLPTPSSRSRGCRQTRRTRSQSTSRFGMTTQTLRSLMLSCIASVVVYFYFTI